MSKKDFKVAIYTRVSTLEQAKKWYWLETQLSNLKNYIIGKNEKWWFFNEKLVYSDKWVSWADEKRPALDRMKKDIELWLIDIVLVWKIDRLYRKTQFLLETVEFFKDNKVEFASKTEEIDTSSATGRLVLTLLWAIAEMEREMIAERTMEGKLTKARNGFYVSGEPPYWYQKSKEWKLEVNEDEAKIVNRIFEMYVNERKSQWEIAHILTAEKINLKSDTMANKKNKPEHTKGIWKQTLISNIIWKTHYIGHYYYNQKEYKKDKNTWKKTSSFKPFEEWIEISCPSIIKKKELYNSAKILSINNQKNAKKKENNRYLLAWILVCWEKWCERSYSWYNSGKRTINYRCKWRNNSTLRKSDWLKCDNPQISWAQIEWLVWDNIKDLINNPKNFNNFLINKSLTDNKITQYRKELKLFEKRKVENEISVKNVFWKMSWNSNLKKYFDEELNKLNTEEWIIINRVIELEQLILSEKNKYTLGSTISDIWDKFKNQIKEIEKDRDSMFKLINILIYKVIVYKNRIDIYFNFDKTKPSKTNTRQKKNLKNYNDYSLSECDQLNFKPGV